MISIDLHDLSLEEKASLLSGASFWRTQGIERAGIPGLILTDGPHGVRLQLGAGDHLGLNESTPATCFPPAVAIGSSWDPELARRVGAAVAREARAHGVSVVLGPGVNIKRSPLCGRNFEYYSEDPHLAGVLGAAHVTGQQDEGVGASIKHFAANNQETERMRISADVDPRALREIYLPAFERVVREAQPATVMCSYNRINGVFASENRWLLTDLLRGEWGFEGAVVSDWGAVNDRVAALRAGLDLEMPGNGGETDAEIVAAVRSGALDEAVLDEAVARVVELQRLLPPEGASYDADAHHVDARRLASESIVLLKNDRSVLPLETPGTIAVIGEFASTPRFQGGGSSFINPTRVDDALSAIRGLASERGGDVVFAPGYALEGSDDAAATLRDEAVRAAASADAVIVFAGLGEAEESEGFDRTTLDLPPAQIDVIRAVAAVAPHTIVVLSNGGVVSLEPWHDEVAGIVEGFLLGQAGGSALADVIFGVVNPSGHLAETIPLRLADTPSYLTFPGEQGHSRYGEGVMVGYRHFSTADVPVRYPFGHGLSYTTFTTDTITAEVIGASEVAVSVTVTNRGDSAGKHVVQVYVATDAGPVRRPARELRAFDKVALEPGETRTVEFALGSRAFAYWDVTQDAWVVAPGEYRIQVGQDAATVIGESAVELVGDTHRTELTLGSTVREWFSHPLAGPALMETLAAGMTEEQRAQAGEQQDQLRMVESMPMKQFIAFLDGAIPKERLEELMVASRAA